MLPDRDAKILSEWLKLHPQVILISRDRSNVYAGATSGTLPNAVQVANRWHLLKNVFDAMTRYVKCKYPNELKIEKQNIGNIEPVEHQHKTKYQIQREKALENKNQRITEVNDLFSKGYNKSQISRVTGLDRSIVSLI